MAELVTILKVFLSMLIITAVGTEVTRSCPFDKISTLSSPVYSKHTILMKEYFDSFNCSFEVHELAEDLKFVKKKHKEHNKFSGNDVKMRSVLTSVLTTPTKSTILWLDATTVMSPFKIYDLEKMLLLLRENDIIVARESDKAKVNIGVLLLRNTSSLRKFLSTILSNIKDDEWDQGIAACMLNRKTKYDCKNVQIDHDIRYDFFPTSLVRVVGIFTHADCRSLLKRLGRQKVNAPQFIKLVGTKRARDVCIQHYDKSIFLGRPEP